MSVINVIMIDVNEHLFDLNIFTMRNADQCFELMPTHYCG